jgi:glyoxylase-like metal-dependent hydrolase (beta-lactamase superfamily II)
MAGWFGESGCELLGSAEEVAVANRLYAIADTDYSTTYASWYRTHGLPAETVDNVLANGNTYANKLFQPPALHRWQKLADGQSVTLAGQPYQVLVGRGHAPDMTMLYRESDHVLIAADQVLPGISPNVSVMPALSDENPLRSFIDSLIQLRQLPSDTLVLPSHGIPFRGLHERIDVLRSHHDQRLNLVLEACSQPVTAFDLFNELYGLGRQLDAQQISFALGESLAHLHYLESEGQVTRLTDSDITRFSTY